MLNRNDLRNKPNFCACGLPLHYTSQESENIVNILCIKKGRFINVQVIGKGSWWIDKHYIALHGLKSKYLPGLGFERSDTEHYVKTESK